MRVATRPYIAPSTIKGPLTPIFEAPTSLITPISSREKNIVSLMVLKVIATDVIISKRVRRKPNFWAPEIMEFSLSITSLFW